MATQRDQGDSEGLDATDLAPAVASLGAIVGLAWLTPAAAMAVHDGTIPALRPAVLGTLHLFTHGPLSHPASAYPSELSAHMPGAAVWWIAACAAVAAGLAATLATWRRLDAAAGRSVLDRRPYQLRGTRPRSWARARDVSNLRVRRPAAGRFTLGKLDGRRLASDDEAHVLVVAPTRSGKTTRCVIPWLLEHDGPAIVTSTKSDVIQATIAWRRHMGHVYVWNPFGAARCASWSPLSGCEDWGVALRRAHWLSDAAQDGDSEVASYWRGEAARLLAPLLHAAAVGAHPIEHVLAWVDGQDAKRPAEVLRVADAEPAIRQLAGVVALDPRNRGTTYMSAGSLLSAYRFPEVLACSRDGLTPEQFLDGKPNTLYVVASNREQRLIAPLVVALLSSMLHAAMEKADRDGPLKPTLRILLDEAANIAPLRDLPMYLSQAAGHGIRMATLWQSIAQLRHRYGSAADDIVANSTAKLFMGPVTDEATREVLMRVLGDQTGTHGADERRSEQSIASAAALQQMATDQAVLIEGRSPSALIEVSPWWADRRIRRRGA